MRAIFIFLFLIFSFNCAIAQSKKEIIQELTIENSNLKQEISKLNDKINSLSTEITSLKKELVVDKVQTPQEYGKTLFDLFISQRLSKYPELQFQLNDTIYFKSNDIEKTIEGIKRTQNNSLDFYLEGINEGIDWSKAKFEKFEFVIKKPEDEIVTNHMRGKFYFNYSGKKFSFRNKISILDNGKWRGYFFDNLINETEKLEKEKKEKQERLNEPYVPRGVKFGNVVYSFNSKEVNPKTMTGLKISVENNTAFAINWIKFQFRIYENGKLLLSKNIIVDGYSGFDSKLEPAEKEIIELRDIEEVYIESGVKNDKWTYDIIILEASPKPIEN